MFAAAIPSLTFTPFYTLAKPAAAVQQIARCLRLKAELLRD